MKRDVSNINSIKVVTLLVKELRLPVTRRTIINEIQRHPNAYSLLAISEALSNWNVPNTAYPVSIEELTETEIPLPFIACFGKGKFVLVKKKSEKSITLSNEQWSNYAMPIEDFAKYYKEVILIFQKESSSGEPNYSAKRRKEIIESARIPFVIFGLIVVAMLFAWLNRTHDIKKSNWHIGVLAAFKTIGLISSIMLLIQSIDSNNSIIQKFCGGDENKNCNAILSSKAAKISEELSWSEVGFFYFAGTWLALLFNNSNENIIYWLAIFNLLSLPYTFYSIYYQWRIAKQWCIFCCTIQAVLWFEFFAYSPYLFNGIEYLDLTDCGKLLICLFIPLLLWVFIKPHLINTIRAKSLEQQLYRFKYNTGLFKKLLEEEKRYERIDTKHTVVLGNYDATNVITVVTNPFCNPCAHAHKILDELLQCKDDIKLQFVFLVGKGYGRQAKVAKHFLYLQAKHNGEKLQEALNDWYGQKRKNYDDWAKNYPVDQNEALVDESIEAQKSWCKMTSITMTPTLFINGRKLPEIYQAGDIKYLL